MRRIDIHISNPDLESMVLERVQTQEPIDCAVICLNEDQGKFISVLLREGTGQTLMDALQDCLKDREGWQITVLPVEATIPAVETVPDSPGKRSENALREELYEDIEAGAALNREFLIFVALSTVVAAIGLNSDGVAAVIGAMVIAPLLGPIMGFSFGVALGDETLLWRGTRTLLVGIVTAMLVAVGLSFVMPIDLESRELITRADVRLDGLALAMASGAAAALSIVRGQGTVLVGVMVAAALLPPGAAVGLFGGAGEWELALRALLLLLLNVASLVLSALVVFRVRGIAPRTWWEKKKAARAVWVNMGLSGVFLLAMIVLIVFLDLGETVTVR